MLLEIAILSFTVLSSNATPPVKTSLRSSWPAPPPLIEVLETVALDNPDSFFPLIDRLTEPEVLTSLQSLSPSVLHQTVLQLGSDRGFLSEPVTVEMNLGLHTATPKIEAFYNYYDDHHSRSPGNGCGSWVDWYGEVICDLDTLARVVDREMNKVVEDASNMTVSTSPQLLTFDHIHPSLVDSPIGIAIFYASLPSPNFRELHSYLLSHSKNPESRLLYVYRHVPPPKRDSNLRSYLSGYGVALNLKKMDYLSIDDRKTKSKDSGREEINPGQPNVEVTNDPVLELIQNFPESEAPEKSKIEVEVKDLGSKAIQLIANSETPLATLIQLTQNFPKYASRIAQRVVTNSSLDEEIRLNALKAQPGLNMFWLNGALISDKDVSPLGLLRLLKKEREIMLGLTGLGMTRKEAFEVLTHEDLADTNQGLGVVDGMVDASDRPEGEGSIIWWNDIEKDKRYSRWPTSLYALLQPTFGSFPVTRFNLFNLVLVLDLSRPTSIAFLTKQLPNIIHNHFPVRIGFVPMLETEDGLKMARLLYYLVQRHGRRAALAFFQQLSNIETDTIDWKFIREQYAIFKDQELSQATDGDTIKTFASLDEVFAGDEQVTKIAFSLFEEKIRTYAERVSAKMASCPFGHAFLNGKHFDMKGDFMRSIQQELRKQLNYLQEKIYRSDIKDEQGESLSTYFYDLPTTAGRRNRYISATGPKNNFPIFHLPDLLFRTGININAGSYMYPAESQSVTTSMYVVADLNSEVGLRLVKEALLSIGPTSSLRVTFIHNPLDPISDSTNRLRVSWLLVHLITHDTLSGVSPDQLLQILGIVPAVPVDDPQGILSWDNTISDLTGGLKLADLDSSRYAEYVGACRRLAKEIGALPGQRFILANGRLVGPLDADDFIASDFSFLEVYERSRSIGPVVRAVESVVEGAREKDRSSYANLISMTSSIIAAIQQPDSSEVGMFDKPQTARSTLYRHLEAGHTKFEVGDEAAALYRIVMLLDPLSETAQKWSSIVQWLSNIPGTHFQINLHPVPLKEMPLKSFYRFNLPPSITFDENGQEIPAHSIFEDLPMEPIYTLAMDVPSSWLVRPREALYDLDNLQLGHLLPGDTSVDAVFDLDYLVIEGHARESNTNSPPRGVQLELVRGSKVNSAPIDDTQVVANLGYIQFKAKPGVFGLDIRKGRGQDIFEMESVGSEGWNSKTVSEVGNEITVASFEGLTLYPRLKRREGMEEVDVLAEPSQKKSILQHLASRVTSLVNPKGVPVEAQAEINIFTVASGLLYERFASIMILSVLRNTKHTVKFWFIENFLSPSFLEFIPHMAVAYNFKYELVTYKWPSWLRAQTEKQRIIWGYKILFLDVLFPMDLKKVIFVDADQIVRADLKELVDLDLQGAPYGYTPMGDDNKDMEGFRFWKTGYWKDFLAGLPYHISALYVIDLVRFRQLAAGDILRGQYQALSADPNSLANLDQDLPNNLQREVPIFSLHEDWLWCETWCSKDRLHRAKTIDLCQNPLTKEPKLSRARQIPEWESYDAEIARFTRKLAEDGVIHSGMAAADANVLANVGTSGESLSKITAVNQNEELHEKAGRSKLSGGEVTEKTGRKDGDEKTRDEL